MNWEAEVGRASKRLQALEQDTMALKMKIDAQHEKLETLIKRVSKLEQKSSSAE